MSSQQKIDANRANGQLSHGPVTDQGKQISSRNAIKHGFTGKTVHISEEEKEAYQAHVRDFKGQYSARTPLERSLRQQLTDLHWAINQIAVEQFDAVRLLQKALAESDAAQAAVATRVLNTLGIYEQRKRRAAAETETQLQAARSSRIGQENADIRRAAGYNEMFKAKGQDWNPADLGFVCTIDQIEAYLDREDLQQELIDFECEQEDNEFLGVSSKELAEKFEKEFGEPLIPGKK
jgi:hypothetical protein